MEDNDALVLIFSRNAFYRRLHFLVLGAFALSLIAIFLLAALLYDLYKNPTHPLYFAADNVSRLLQIVPVSNPNMSTDQVIQWTVKAIETAYSYDYVNFHEQLQEAQNYFTPYGWSKYMSALVASNNLVAVTQRRYVALAQVVGQPKILREGILAGAYAWNMQMPVLVTYSYPPYDDKSRYSNPLIVTVIVQRQPALEGDKGLGIVQLIGSYANLGNSQQPAEISNTPTG